MLARGKFGKNETSIARKTTKEKEKEKTMDDVAASNSWESCPRFLLLLLATEKTVLVYGQRRPKHVRQTRFVAVLQRDGTASVERTSVLHVPEVYKPHSFGALNREARLVCGPK